MAVIFYEGSSDAADELIQELRSAGLEVNELDRPIRDAGVELAVIAIILAIPGAVAATPDAWRVLKSVVDRFKRRHPSSTVDVQEQLPTSE